MISDTHGKNIDWISAYAEKIKADLCIHSGDFGFYDESSVDAFPQRELFLQVTHSDINGKNFSFEIYGADDHRVTREDLG